VLDVTALGQTIREARERAYAAAEKISFENKYARTDIALAGVAAEEARER
jgi:phosphoribosylglycinamide synthetase, C domain